MMTREQRIGLLTEAVQDLESYTGYGSRMGACAWVKEVLAALEAEKPLVTKEQCVIAVRAENWQQFAVLIDGRPMYLSNEGGEYLVFRREEAAPCSLPTS